MLDNIIDVNHQGASYPQFIVPPLLTEDEDIEGRPRGQKHTTRLTFVLPRSPVIISKWLAAEANDP